MPNAVSQAVAYPSVQGFEFAYHASVSEVVQPSSLYLFQFKYPLIETFWTRLACDFLDTGFEFLPTLFHHNQLVFAFAPFLKTARKAVSQYLKVEGLSNSALFTIDGQFQFVLQEKIHLVAYLSGFTFAFAVNAKVIGIAYEFLSL